MLLMSVTLPKTQSDLCPVLDFRQSVEAIGLVVADYCASTCDCRSKGRDGGFVLHKINANELLLQCPTRLSMTISCSPPRCLLLYVSSYGRNIQYVPVLVVVHLTSGTGTGVYYS